MARNATAPVTVRAVDRGREVDHAAELINSHLKATLLETQAEHLQRHYLLPAPIARAVREIAEGSFVAVVDEHVLGPFYTGRQATDAVLDLARAGGAS